MMRGGNNKGRNLKAERKKERVYLIYALDFRIKAGKRTTCHLHVYGCHGQNASFLFSLKEK